MKERIALGVIGAAAFWYWTDPGTDEGLSMLAAAVAIPALGLAIAGVPERFKNR